MSEELLDFNIDPLVNSIYYIPLLSKEEEISLAKQVAEGSIEAKNKFIMSNIRLVINIAKKFANRGMPLIDLINEGVFGLIRAVEKYDPSKGTRFSTYATNWVRTFISKALQKQSGAIYVPIHAQQKLNVYCKICNNEIGNEDIEQVLIDALGKDAVEKSEELYRITQDAFSLSETICENEFTFEDALVEDGEEDNSFERDVLLRHDIGNALSILGSSNGEETEAQLVIAHKFGLLGKEKLSREEIIILLNDLGFYKIVVHTKKYECSSCGVIRRFQAIQKEDSLRCEKCGGEMYRQRSKAPHNKDSVKDIEEESLEELKKYLISNGYDTDEYGYKYE